MEGDRRFRPPRVRAEVIADPACVHYLSDLTKRFLTDSLGLDERSETCAHLRIAIAELVANVVRHGYRDGAPGPLALELAGDADGVLVRLVDAAPPFDISARAELPEAGALAEGGYGLGIVHATMDSVEWRSVGDCGNEVTLRRVVPAGSSALGGT